MENVLLLLASLGMLLVGFAGFALVCWLTAHLVKAFLGK